MRKEPDLSPPSAYPTQGSRRSILLWASLAVPSFLLIATCLLVAREISDGDAASERAARSQTAIRELGELREALTAAGGVPPDGRARAVAEARRVMAAMQKTGIGSAIYPAELARVQQSAEGCLVELEAQGAASKLLAGTASTGGHSGVAHHATFTKIEALEARERFASELEERMEKHHKDDTEAGLLIAGFLVVVLQAWIWAIFRIEYRQRARVEQFLRASNHQLEESVQERTASLTAANRRFIHLQEQERRSLARELHDQLGQQMATLLLNLRRLRNLPATEDARELTPLLTDSIGIAHTAYEQVRNIALELRPALLDRLGLVSAVEWYARQQEARAGCEVSVSADPHANEVSSEVATAAFRIIQEAVTNAIRHGEPESITIFLQCQDGSLELTVHDDGIGFDVSTAADPGRDGLGLPGMRERARMVGGTFSIRSSADDGTEIDVRLPLREQQLAEDQPAVSG